MAVVMAAVFAIAVFAGLAPLMALAFGVLAAGVVGVASVTRGPGTSSAADAIAAMMASQQPGTKPAVDPEQATAVEAMAPPENREVDPEANMPRWRRPSLLEARRSDPTRYATSHRTPLRFTDDQIYQFDVRLVRYAVVPLLDRPDEVHGLHLADLESGDEVQVLSAGGTFLEVHCPNGERGWVHRTTLRHRDAAASVFAAAVESHDDALGALLAARGLPQS